MIITDIIKQDKRVEVRMIDEGTAFNVELRPYKVNDIDDVIHEVLNGLRSYELPLGAEAEEFPDELVEEEIREYITYYAD